jgi:hypothetical protein
VSLVGRWIHGPTCLACPAIRPEDASYAGWRGPYCYTCNRRWQRQGRPEGGPRPSRQRATGSYADRLEDYAELRSWGVSVAEAAGRVGISVDAATRNYEPVVQETAARRDGRAA